jgi:hypothetical protein
MPPSLLLLCLRVRVRVHTHTFIALITLGFHLPPYTHTHAHTSARTRTHKRAKAHTHKRARAHLPLPFRRSSLLSQLNRHTRALARDIERDVSLSLNIELEPVHIALRPPTAEQFHANLKELLKRVSGSEHEGSPVA